MKFKRVQVSAEGAEGRRDSLAEDPVQHLGLLQVPLRALCVDLCVLCGKAVSLTSPAKTSIFAGSGPGKMK